MRLRKGISPIVATVLLILVAIATGIVIYAFAAGWVGTRFSEASGPQAILVVESAYYDYNNNKFVLYVRNDGTGTAKITRAYITAPDGTVTKAYVYDSESNGNNYVEIKPGEFKPVYVDYTGVTKGYTYTVKLVSVDGSEVTTRVRA